MSLFKSKQPMQTASTGPDYYFLDRIAPTISIEAAAHLKAVKAALAERPVTVLSGGLDPRANDNFTLYRDKGHFFAKGTPHENFFAELHGHREMKNQPLTALPLAGYLGDLQTFEDYARSATVYHDGDGQPIYRVDRDERGRVSAINYFAGGQPVRVDTYDQHQRLLMSEQFGATANSAQLVDGRDAPTVHSIMSRTLYSEAGRPVFAQTFSPSELWLLDDHAVPVRLFQTEAALMAAWLMDHVDRHNHLYVAADTPIFAQLASYDKLREHLIPIVQDKLDPAVLAGTPFTEILVSEGLNPGDFTESAKQITTMPNWLGFKPTTGWSVFKHN